MEQQHLEDHLRATLKPLGRASLADMMREVTPAVGVLRELRHDDTHDSTNVRESLTVLTLLGRRLALLDITVSSALSAVHSVLEMLRKEHISMPERFEVRARAAIAEGFVIGREEHIAETLQTTAASCIQPMKLPNNWYALILSGTHEPDVVREKIDELGRVMLDHDSTIACIDVSQHARPTPEHATALFSADHVLRVVGARTLFSGVDVFWREAAEQSRLNLQNVETFQSLADAMLAAEQDTTPEPRGLLQQMLRRLKK